MSNSKNNGKSVFQGLLSAAKQEPKIEPKLNPNITDSQSNLGKRQRNGYRQTTIYVNIELQRKVKRLLEDLEFHGDFSDWIEQCMIHEIENTSDNK